MVVMLGDVLFDFSKVDINLNVILYLVKFVVFFNINSDCIVIIEGYIDNSGDFDFNV